MEYYSSQINEVIEKLDSNEQGLSSKEVQNRIENEGLNKIEEGKKVTLVRRFFNQLKDPMIFILFVAAIVSGITAYYANESYADVIIIMFVVIINAVLGVYQENKAEKAIQALQDMTAPTCSVLRDGEVKEIETEKIVRGDIVILEAGDLIPADGRIIESASLKVEEAALTGESVPVSKITGTIKEKDNKKIPLGDRKNMAYKSSIVAYGRGKMVVTETGMKTQVGKIAEAISNAEQGKTPLQKKLHQLSKVLTYVVVSISIFIFLFSLFREGDFHSDVIIDTFMIAVSLAVAAIPEGLAMVVTVVLSVGVTNMAKRKAIIRRLTAVETLGSAQIICSDKTGTLTQNKMTVTEHYGYSDKITAKVMVLCNDSKIDNDENISGEPTETALVRFAQEKGLNKVKIEQKENRIGEAPFDSDRKMMSTVHQTEEEIIQYTKGAPDEVLEKCIAYIDDQGNEKSLDNNKREEIIQKNKQMASNALRVLCAAMKKYDGIPDSYEPKSIENDLIFVGLTGMIDPIREEVKESIKECRDAGITPIMITGDHKITAVAIGRELGMIQDESQAITGSDLDEMSESELKENINNYRVYARVQPEHKVRIVKAWKANDKVTAMTGDGVNDAPALKNADIGVGMGITGTDVTKNVADMVLADDNFATIVNAVEEGRKIYNNIRKTIQYLLASNLSEVLSIFVATLFGFVILHPVHLLWINLITDTFPALALGMEKGEEDLMKNKPRPTNEGVFAGGLGPDLVYQGIVVTILTLFAYFIGHYIESGVWEITQSQDGITMAFLTLSISEIFHSFNLRSKRNSLFKLKGQNKFLWGAAIASFLLTTTVIYVPFLAKAFKFEHISIKEYVISILISACVIPIVEIVKLIQRRLDKNKK